MSGNCGEMRALSTGEAESGVVLRARPGIRLRGAFTADAKNRDSEGRSSSAPHPSRIVYGRPYGAHKGC